MVSPPPSRPARPRGWGATLSALALLFLVGCTVPPDAVTAPQGAENAQEQAGAAREAQARSQAAALSKVAQLYVTVNAGSPDGLAAELRSTEPALVAGAYELTDEYVSFELQPGECLHQPLPSGSPRKAPC